jgi:hypothetical protein
MFAVNPKRIYRLIPPIQHDTISEMHDKLKGLVDKADELVGKDLQLGMAIMKDIIEVLEKHITDNQRDA